MSRRREAPRTAGPPRTARRRRVVTGIAAVASALVLLSLSGGLGALPIAGDRSASATPVVAHTPVTALTQMLHALGSADVRTACTVAAPGGFPIRGEDDLRKCGRDLRKQLEGVDERDLRGYGEVVVERAEIAGSSATIRPRDIANAPVAMRNAVYVLVESGGRWYVVV